MTTPCFVAFRRRTLARFAASLALALAPALLTGRAASQEAATVGLQAYDPAREAVVAPLAGDTTIDLSDFETRRLGILARTTGPAESVVFDVDGHTVAVRNEPPFLLTFDVADDGRLTFPERATSTDSVEVGIGDGSDDVEEFVRDSSDDPSSFPEGYTYTRSSDLELGHDPDHAPQRIALRFTGVDVPEGAIVTAAEVVFTADGDSSGPMTVTLQGEASPDAAPFAQDDDGTGTAEITARPTTAEERRWELASDDSWSDGETYVTPDLSAIVQEIVDQEAWRPGASLALLVSADGDGVRRAASYDAAPDRAPILRVSYRIEPSQVVLPPGPHLLTVTPYGETEAAGSAGEPVEVRFDVVESQSGPEEANPATPEPDQADEDEPTTEGQTPDAPTREAVPPDADPPAATAAPDAPPPAVAEQAEPDDGTRQLRFPLHSTEDDRIVGSILLSVYPGILPVVTVQADRPFDGPVSIIVRSQGCQPTGELVTTATTISEASSFIVGTLDLGVGTLLAAEFGIHVADASSGTSLACSSLDEEP